MVDMFPFPSITGTTPDEKVKDLTNYMIQFKEALEFTLMNISVDNLSPDLINTLNELGTNIEKNNEDRANEIAQVAQFSSITVSDVLNSDLFKSIINDKILRLHFTVNFDTGNLEYDIV